MKCFMNVRRCVHVLWTHSLLSPGYPRALRTSRGQGNSRRAGTTLQPSLHPFTYFSPISSSSLHLYPTPAYFLLSLLLFFFIGSVFLQYRPTYYQLITFFLPSFRTLLIFIRFSLWQQTAPWFSLPSPVSSRYHGQEKVYETHFSSY